jgi:3-oxoacyl-[acyl-carrier-protein] synthase II
VLPNSERQESCINKALKSAGLAPEEIDLVNTHATGTPAGDRAECKALQKVFSGNSTPYFNNTKSMIGHCMGGAGALELAGNLNSFKDGMVHPTINLTDLDPECELPNLVSESAQPAEITTILNNSFGMMGINSTLIVSRYSS